jgi:hypothetical protein
LKAVHEQEVAELSRLQTIVGFDPAQFYRTELERAIRDIRGDFEQLNQEQKRELEEWYRIKTEEVEKEVAKEREFQRVSTIGLSAEETNSLKQSHLESQREYVELQRRHSELSARLRELEERLEQSKSANQLTLIERDREISALREKISELMATYDELMNRKTSLEFEINTYRRLLECEETRIRTAANNTNISSTTYSYSSSRGTGSTSGNSNAINSATLLPSSGTVNLVSQTVLLPPQAAQTVQSVTVSSTTSSAQNQNNNNEVGGSRSQFTQRGSSAELSSETITKRMQVQRTSKGNLFEDNDLNIKIE